ncbi:J domain-containing protein [Hymenobacter sp. DG25A]|uniref:J domain-containing protein n=1 Tax=Hymenobacter sp. DG25A TaxID=1385663 RepID=UPI000A4F313F|nr:J domain-containing protein [Hymenobacter sp. DG25A]
MTSQNASLQPPRSLPVPGNAVAGSAAQQAFRAAVEQVEGLRQRLTEVRQEQADARRQYWKQVGPLAEVVVAARRALFPPLEEALLLDYFSRAEHRQLEEVIIGNARSLQDRFGEDASDILSKYAPASRKAGSADTAPAAGHSSASPEENDQPRPHEQAAHEARNRRKTKADRAREAAEQTARDEQQRLLSNTKTVYRQLARANHPDLERDPALQQHKTARMQRITEAYEANDLYTLLQLLSESGPADQEADDVLLRYTKALQQQQTELKQQLQALLFGAQSFLGSTGKKREQELRQLKRHLRAEAEYLQHISQLIQEPEGLREVLRSIAAEGHETI